MSDYPWFPMYQADFIGGVIKANLTAEEIAVYAMALSLMYDKGEAIDNDPKWLGGLVRLSTRKASKVIASLVEKGKLLVRDGRLSNRRFEEIQQKRAEKTEKKPRKNSYKSTEKTPTSNKNNNLDEKTPPTELRTQKDVTNVTSPCGDSDWLFGEGADYLVSKRETRQAANSVIGLWLKEHPPPIVRQALQQAQTACAANPTAFVAKVLRAKGSAQDAKPVMDEKWASALNRFDQRFG